MWTPGLGVLADPFATGLRGPWTSRSVDHVVGDGGQGGPAVGRPRRTSGPGARPGPATRGRPGRQARSGRRSGLRRPMARAWSGSAVGATKMRAAISRPGPGRVDIRGDGADVAGGRASWGWRRRSPGRAAASPGAGRRPAASAAGRGRGRGGSRRRRTSRSARSPWPQARVLQEPGGVPDPLQRPVELDAVPALDDHVGGGGRSRWPPARGSRGAGWPRTGPGRRPTGERRRDRRPEPQRRRPHAGQDQRGEGVGARPPPRTTRRCSRGRASFGEQLALAGQGMPSNGTVMP